MVCPWQTNCLTFWTHISIYFQLEFRVNSTLVELELGSNQAVKQAAERRGETTVTMIRRLIRIGLVVDEVGRTPGREFIIREPDGSESKVLMV